MTTTWKDIQRQEDPENPTCTCEDCGKKFPFGSEGDNQTVCLRCEANFIASKRYDYAENDFCD